MEERPEDFDLLVSDAMSAAAMSTCSKSHRGAIVFGDPHRSGYTYVYGGGYNSPPGEGQFVCSQNENCFKMCNKICVHAEQMAICEMLDRRREDILGADILHVKSVDGVLVPSGPPSCVECSKLILQVGLSGVWLFHEHGWKRYTATDFHQKTLEYLGLVGE